MESKENVKCIASLQLKDGTLVEMIYRPDADETALATYKEGELEEHAKIKRGNYVWVPYKSEQNLIQKGVVLFPECVEEYDSIDDLIALIKDFIHKYVDLPKVFETISVYYVLLSYLYDKFPNILYLRFIGDTGTGKSRALDVIGSICYRPMRITGAASTSPVFRIIDMYKGTLVLDEADFVFSDTYAEIIKILNNGYQKERPVLRSEGDNKKNWDVRSYDCFCPKVIATRFPFKDLALESRCLTQVMDSTDIRDDIPLNLPDDFEEEARSLRNKLLAFRFDHFHDIYDCINTNLDKSIEPRLRQLISIMLSIVKDKNAREDVINFMTEYNKQLISDRALGYEVLLVEALFNLYCKNVSPITVKELTEEYNRINVDEKDKSYSSIGRILKNRLHITTEHKRGGRYIKEDDKEKLEALFKRYGFDVKDVNLVKDDGYDKDGKPIVTLDDINF